MKTKVRKIVLLILSAAIILLAAASLYFFRFTSSGYRMTVPYRGSFEEIAEHVYINRNYAGERAEVLSLIGQAKERVAAFYGELQCFDTTEIIICDDAKLLKSLGGDKDTNTVPFPAKKHYISVSAENLNLDILSHELTHAELHTRLNNQALKGIPTWFDEGVATQNDYRGQYSEESWRSATDNGKNIIPLDEMDTREEFYAGEAKDRRFRYMLAKHEVYTHFADDSQLPLLSLIDELNSGKNFDSVYFR